MNNAYSPSIDSLHEIDNSHDRQNIKLGLGRIKSCLNSIGNPEKKFKSVIIGGTNGKGSVTYYLSNLAYRYSKLKIGRYTSPHLVFFNERYVINETPVTNEKLNKIAAESIRQIKEFEKKTNERLTAFEIYTIIGFDLFARENVDLAFIEVGMGGRLDATNVVEPKDTICSIITNVSFDHKNHLGSRIEDIAYEKAGIIKENNHTITGATDIALNIIQERAQELNNGLLKIKTTNPASNYIERNIGIALTTWKLIIEKLGIDETIKDDKVTFLKSLQYAGRFHLLNEKYLIDCAHNPDGAIELNKLLDEYYRDKKKIFIIGMLDKEYDIFISNLIPKNSTVICTEPKSNRATKKEALQKAALAIGCKVVVEENIKSAIAKASSFNPELIIITGSVYLAGEAISVLSTEH